MVFNITGAFSKLFRKEKKLQLGFKEFFVSQTKDTIKRKLDNVNFLVFTQQHTHR